MTSILKNLTLSTLFLALVLTGFGPKKVSAAETFKTTFGSPEQILKESDFSPDFPYWSHKINNTWYGFIASGVVGNKNYNPVLFKLGDNPQIKTLTGLGKGSRDAFDGDGRWMGGMHTDLSGTLHGFYHSETVPPPGQKYNFDIWSIAYTKSRDNGSTWIMPDYPGNQIITARKGTGWVGGQNWSVGQLYLTDGSKYFTGDNGKYLYMLYGVRADVGYRDGIARALITSNGVPGSWKKYYCDSAGCDFKEPGIGGKETIFQGPWTFAYSTYLHKFIGIAIPGDNGIKIWTSDDLIHWSDYKDKTVFEISGPGFYSYPSIVSLSGDSSEVGQEFYYYYAQVGTEKRQLFRRKVTLSQSDGNNGIQKADMQNFWLPFYTQKFGQIPTRGKLDGDFNSDRKVDGLDYVLWFKEALT